MKTSRYHLFLHYGWFLQNHGKDFIPTNMHTTVYNPWVIHNDTHTVSKLFELFAI